jgi:hypothetical protein
MPRPKQLPIKNLGLNTIKKGETMAKSKAHPGFKAVQNQIAKREGVSKKQAGAILAAATRRASPAAKRKNPNLKKVRG